MSIGVMLIRAVTGMEPAPAADGVFPGGSCAGGAGRDSALAATGDPEPVQGATAKAKEPFTLAGTPVKYALEFLYYFLPALSKTICSSFACDVFDGGNDDGAEL